MCVQPVRDHLTGCGKQSAYAFPIVIDMNNVVVGEGAHVRRADTAASTPGRRADP